MEARTVIEIIVEHFFTGQGQQRFPVWIGEIEALARRYPGFVDIRQMTLLDEPDRCFFRMSFRTPEDARRWTTSSERKGVLALMEPFRVGELHATQWLTGESQPAAT
jgi:antibiotic biosynthesis monooxygenase (ABM) superfamily enzyme